MTRSAEPEIRRNATASEPVVDLDCVVATTAAPVPHSPPLSHYERPIQSDGRPQDGSSSRIAKGSDLRGQRHCSPVPYEVLKGARISWSSTVPSAPPTTTRRWPAEQLVAPLR